MYAYMVEKKIMKVREVSVYYEFGGQRWGIYPVLVFDENVAKEAAEREGGEVVTIHYNLVK